MGNMLFFFVWSFQLEEHSPDMAIRRIGSVCMFEVIQAQA